MKPKSKLVETIYHKFVDLSKYSDNDMRLIAYLNAVLL